MLLQPTSPIRDVGLIDLCISKFKETNADNLATGFICKFKEYGSYTQRRQDLKGFFYDDGNVYVMKADMVKKGDRYGKKHEKVMTSRKENLEIDDIFDFFMVESALKDKKI